MIGTSRSRWCERPPASASFGFELALSNGWRIIVLTAEAARLDEQELRLVEMKVARPPPTGAVKRSGRTGVRSLMSPSRTARSASSWLPVTGSPLPPVGRTHMWRPKGVEVWHGRPGHGGRPGKSPASSTKCNEGFGPLVNREVRAPRVPLKRETPAAPSARLAQSWRTPAALGCLTSTVPVRIEASFLRRGHRS
jgi:hypothetical protein